MDSSWPLPAVVCYTPIGVIRSPHATLAGMPVQPTGALGVRGTIEVDPLYAEGLLDLAEFSHIIAIYHLHRITGYDLLAKPFLDNRPHGVFATRFPRRPNPIGMSALRLMGVDGCLLRVENIDILDGTPLLDIKPYVPPFDAWPADRYGWFQQKAGRAEEYRTDESFRS